MGFRHAEVSFTRRKGFNGFLCSTETHPHPNRRVGFAQPTRFGGAERCSAKPRLNPLEGEGIEVVHTQTFSEFTQVRSVRDAFSGPLGRCRATEKLADKGRGLFEGRRPEFRSPRQFRVAQGTGQSPAPYGGRLFFGDFLLAKQKKVTRAASAKPSANKDNAKDSRASSAPLRP